MAKVLKVQSPHASKRLMENKAFAKQLEKRTREFAVKIITLSAKLPNTPESKVIKNQITKSGTLSVQTTGKRIVPEAKRISRTRSGFAKVKPVKLSIG